MCESVYWNSFMLNNTKIIRANSYSALLSTKHWATHFAYIIHYYYHNPKKWNYSFYFAGKENKGQSDHTCLVTQKMNWWEQSSNAGFYDTESLLLSIMHIDPRLVEKVNLI